MSIEFSYWCSGWHCACRQSQRLYFSFWRRLDHSVRVTCSTLHCRLRLLSSTDHAPSRPSATAFGEPSVKNPKAAHWRDPKTIADQMHRRCQLSALHTPASNALDSRPEPRLRSSLTARQSPAGRMFHRAPEEPPAGAKTPPYRTRSRFSGSDWRTAKNMAIIVERVTYPTSALARRETHTDPG